jgi:enoyl-[acyl-carrier-protein] reductase (NADH)
VVVNLLDQKVWNTTPDFVSYTLSKAALDAANSMLALALQPLVRVVGIAPDTTLTAPMLKGETLAHLQGRMQGPLPAGVTASALDASAAVLLVLQDPSISGTTLLVQDPPGHADA